MTTYVAEQLKVKECVFPIPLVERISAAREELSASAEAPAEAAAASASTGTSAEPPSKTASVPVLRRRQQHERA